MLEKKKRGSGRMMISGAQRQLDAQISSPNASKTVENGLKKRK